MAGLPKGCRRGSSGVVLNLNREHLHYGNFFGRPRLRFPTGMSQWCSLHFGQRMGLPLMRFTQACPQRRQSQIMLFGIGILRPINHSPFFSCYK